MTTVEEIEFAPDLPAVAQAARLVGLTHSEALEREIPATDELVEEMVEAGTVGTIASLPELGKSFLAVNLGSAVAGSGRDVLGRKAVLTGPVGYFWQDDSEANELRRIQQYSRRHGLAAQLPLRWYLNEGLRLPDGLPDLRAEIERHEFLLVILDSLYNFVSGGIKLKEEEVGALYADVKAEVCDTTGCSVCFVDHSPWPTDSNRGQRRGYGSVFKAAAIRWGIYLDSDGGKLHVEAHGNNLAGVKRSPALFDDDALELRLVDVAPKSTVEELRRPVLEWLREHLGRHSTSAVRGAIKGTDSVIDETLLELWKEGEIGLSVGGVTKSPESVGADEPADWRRQRAKKEWNASVQAGFQSADSFTPTDADSNGAARTSSSVGGSASPRRGNAPPPPTESSGVKPPLEADPDEAEIERLAALARSTSQDGSGVLDEPDVFYARETAEPARVDDELPFDDEEPGLDDEP